MFSGCSQSSDTSPQKLYGSDSDYYIALRKIGTYDEKEAVRLLQRCAKNGSAYAARRSAETLTTLGNVKDRLEACGELVKAYKDDDALLTACREYKNDEEYSQIIVLTGKTDILTADDELVYLHLISLAKRSDDKFDSEMYTWFTRRPMSEWHYRLFSDTANDDDTDQNKIINFRIEVYQRSYHTAYAKLADIRRITGQGGSYPLTAQLVSDMGKACLYGSTDNLANARLFNQIADTAGKTDNDIAYNAWFYAGRIYDKSDDSFSTAQSRFTRALSCAKTDRQYDNALWYLLNDSLRDSPDNTIGMLKKYCTTWHDPAYFDDFFELFAPLLLSQARWNDFESVYHIIDGYASDEVTAKFAYIYGRLVQEKYASPSDADQAQKDAFTRALRSGSDTYYKALAAGQLDLDDAATEEVMCSSNLNKAFARDEQEERFLEGYASFGLPEKIYPEWLSFFEKGKPVSLSCAADLSSFLAKSSDGKDEFYAQSLRIITRTANKSDAPLTPDVLRLMYPCNYSDAVAESCRKFGLSEETMYALIRSESFFDPEAVSGAGAVGLTQLMEFTAGDISQRLKKLDYNLKDPKTNIEFGAYYLANLIQRLDGSILSAFFSYNAGISRVRRWIQSSRIELGGRQDLPYDLFLETIPYAETREYGRKLVSASAAYGWLYCGKSVHGVVTEILK